MSNSFDDIPFFDEEPGEPPRKQPAPAAPAAGGLAARAMAARDGGRRPDYLSGLNPLSSAYAVHSSRPARELPMCAVRGGLGRAQVSSMKLRKQNRHLTLTMKFYNTAGGGRELPYSNSVLNYNSVMLEQFACW